MTEKAVNLYRPAKVSPPGTTVADLLEEKGIRQNELATRMDVSPKFVNEIIAGKAPITPPTALALERALGTPAGFWLAREARYQESRAREAQSAELEDSIPWLDEIPHRDMLRFGWIRKAASQVDLVDECLGFFGVANVDAWRAQYSKTMIATAYRRSTKVATNHGAMVAWLREGERQGSRIECTRFNRDAFLEAIDWARSQTLIDDPREFLPRLIEKFAACGVAVVIVRAPKNCPISGSVRWLTPTKALVQLSFKYLRNDNFWFTFFHECGHVLLHSKKLLFVEGTEVDDEDEEQANRFAADKLIPPAAWAGFSPMVLSESAIREFAEQVGIAPGIVLGRLQNEGQVQWNRMTHLKVKYQWTED